MPLKFHQSSVLLNFLQEKKRPQIIGEILHFVLSNLCVKRIFNPKEEDLENLLKKALFLYPYTLQEREELKKEALEKLKKAINSPLWRDFTHMLSSASSIYREIEGFLGTKESFIRPDLLVFKEDEVHLWEFKLRESDFNEEQATLYKTFLMHLFPKKKKKFFLLTFEPFEFRLLDDDSKNLFNSTQLPLFKNFN
ncbi:MAG: hypothetical protein ACK4Y7_04835 [Caldimicrobium sp.]